MDGKFTLIFAVFLSLWFENAAAGRPQFELNPQYSDSYLPAAMQVIAYLSETMKYELRPQSQQPSTTPAPRPTPAHRPGLFQPSAPPPHRLLKALQNSNLNDKTLGSIIRQLEPFLPAGLHELDLELLGEGAKNLHRVINVEVENNSYETFLETFDDDARNSDLIGLLKQRKMPPTRAYVTLLSIYDLMNKETKRLNLNQFNGFSESLLNDLNLVSTGTSSYQLEYLLKKILEQREIADAGLERKITTLIADLQKQDSYINMALVYIPALPFAL